MWILTLGAERRTLGIGDHVIGGTASDAVPLESLAGFAPSARLTIANDATIVVRRLSAGIIVRVDGQPLGAADHALRDGAEIDVAGTRLVVTRSPAASAPAATRDGSAAATQLAPAVVAPHAHIVDTRSGARYPVQEGELVIGRDASCDIVLDGVNMSRRHARITALGGELTVVDESANGTRVNGARITGRQQLRHGDRIVFPGGELRVELVGARHVPSVDGGAATQLLPSAASPVAAARPAAERGAPTLGVLEVRRGSLAGTRYVVGRPVCAIGRGEQNDVRILDESVSASHATLLFKAGAWYVIDLRSSNGTFVDDYRVAGERILPPGGVLRIGKIEMTFKPHAAPPAGTARRDPTQHAVGLVQRLSRLLSGNSR